VELLWAVGEVLLLTLAVALLCHFQAERIKIPDWSGSALNHWTWRIWAPVASIGIVARAGKAAILSATFALEVLVFLAATLMWTLVLVYFLDRLAIQAVKQGGR
jgi:hypothetical protein